MVLILSLSPLPILPLTPPLTALLRPRGGLVTLTLVLRMRCGRRFWKTEKKKQKKERKKEKKGKEKMKNHKGLPVRPAPPPER